MSDPATGPGACPGQDAWLDLVDDRLDAPRRAALLDHLRGCPQCTALVAGLGARWSLADLCDRAESPRGPATRAFEARLEALGPRHASEPVDGAGGIPCIPGFGELTLVGHGGMGVVYRATELALGRPVALKLLPIARLASPTALLRAEREAQVLARIDHPGVVRVFSTGSAAGTPWIAMEWIDGPTLGRRIGTAPLPHREAAAIARDLARALEQVHAAGIVHRDIKPDNVLLATPAAGALPVAKLVDFGLARPDDPDGGLTMAAAPLGTPSFMAPEQTGRDPALGLVGPATDIHGLGATLYCMLTGRAPYHGATAGESLARAAQGDAPALSLAAPGVPLDLRTIVETCLRRRPEQRYASAAALADDLTRFLDGRPIRARAVGRMERCLKWARRRPALAAALGAVVLAGLGAVGGTVYHLRQLRAAYAVATESRDAALAAGGLARRSFERLTDDSAERLLVRGRAFDDGDRDHLLRVRTEYRDWPLEPDVAAGLRFRIAGLRRVAMLFQRLSRPKEMLATLDMALAAIDDMERRGLLGAAEERLRHELLRGRRSDLLQRGLVDEAVVMTRAEIARLESRVGAVPSLWPHLASAHGDLAAILNGQGKGDEAADHFRRALDLFDRLTAASAAADVPVHLELSVRFNATISHVLGGDPASRVALATRLVARAEAILATDPADASDRQAASRALLMGLRILADGALAGGDPTAALAHLRRLSEAARVLAAANPQDHSFTDEVVMAARQGLLCHERLGKPAAAAEDLAAAIELASRGVADEPASLPRARTLATALKTEADMLRTIGDLEGSLANHQRIVEVMGPWLAAEGGGDEARRIAVAALVDAGKAAQALERREAAIAALEQAVPLAPPDTRPAIEGEIAVLRLADRPDAVAGP